MDAEERDGVWITTVEVTAPSHAELIRRTAAVERQLKKFAAEKPKPRRARGEGALYRRARDGMWVGQIELEKSPDGKRRKSKPVYSKDHATCVEKLGKLRDDLARGIEQKSDRRLTVKVYLLGVSEDDTDGWINTVAKTNLRPHAWKSYRSAINTRIVPVIGGRRLWSLSPDDVRYMHQWILGATYTRGKSEEEHHYSTRSVEEAHNVLSAALGDAVSGGHAPRNVCELVKKPKVLSEGHGSLTTDQARAVLLASLAAQDPMVTRWAAGLMLGGRQGEILGLEWDRIDLERRALDLSWQLEWLPLKPGADPEDPERFDVRPDFEYRPIWRGAAWTRPKSYKSTRMIPIPEPLAAILTVLRERSVSNPWGLVWVSQPKARSRYGQGVTPVSDLADREGWAAAQELARVDPVSVHGMRGTTATLLLEAGVADSVSQSIMGHSKVAMTRRYQTVNLDLARQALGNLGGLLELPG